MADFGRDEMEDMVDVHDSKLFEKILSRMHSEFNKTVTDVVEEEMKIDEELNGEETTAEMADESKEEHQTEEPAEEVEEPKEPADQPRLILKLKTKDDEPKRSHKTRNKEKTKRSLLEVAHRKRRRARTPREEVALKRSSRRMSKEHYAGESVLQNAIARKEKSLISFSQEDRPRRSTRLSDEKHTQPAPRSSSRSKILTRSHTIVEPEVNSNSPLPSPHEDTSSDMSSVSCRKPRPQVKSKETDWNSTELNPATEGEEAPEANDEHHSTASSGRLCECESLTSLFTRSNSNTYCTALDTFDDKLVKCSTPSSCLPLLRPCKIVPYQNLCQIHFERMLRHHACSTCGHFCTQGIVNICGNKHFFHKECVLKYDSSNACPHCGSTNFSLYKIHVKNHQYPLFLPSTMPPSKLPMAKITFSRGRSNRSCDRGRDDMDHFLPHKSLTLPNGKIVSYKGIPLCDQEKLNSLKLGITLSTLEGRYSLRHFYQAAKHGDAEKVIAMIGMGLSPNQSTMNPLHAATKEGHLLVVHILAQCGADLETLDKHHYTPLMSAVQFKQNSIVKYLVKAGASVTFKGCEGMTALHIAAKEGNIEACHYLLSGANIPATFIDTVDDGRWTALVWAAENSHSKVVRYLLEKRADPHIRDSEMNIALHWSAFAGSSEITEDLLNYRCNLNLSNTHGDTPLHIAARQGADCCVVLLLARGARVDIMNKAGQLPKDCVIDKTSYCYSAIELNMAIKKTISPTSLYPRILSNDISQGREDNPIQCMNAVDDEGLPRDFTYVRENCFTSPISIDRRISSLVFCNCEDGCSIGCMCTKISRGSWYDSTGKLVESFNFDDPPMLFECNQACGCNVLTCKNRVVQKGLKSRLQLIKTPNKNWGVISLKEIPKGSYVCEYVGEIISDNEADTRKDDSYLFDLDNAEGDTYCLDARKYGNICRFINHSCRPNLSPVKVFLDHQDLHFPRIAMFANRDILPNEELGFDYGDKFWIIKCKSFTCCCGEDTCRYSESTIAKTLERYQEKSKEDDSVQNA